MKGYIYYAKNGQNFFLILPHQVEAGGVPEALRDKVKDMEYIGSQEIITGKGILGIESKEIKDQIKKQGFYIKDLNVKDVSIGAMHSSFAGSAIGSALLLGSLLGPVGWIGGSLLGLWIANKAKEEKNDSNL